MAVCRQEMPVLVFLIIQLDIVGGSPAHKLIPLVHLHTERAEYLLSLLRLLYNRASHLISLVCRGRKHCQIMFQKFCVCIEFHHLRINEHEFEFRRMLGIQKRRDNDIQSDGLTLLGSTSDKQVRCGRKIEGLDLLRNGVSESNRKFIFAVTERGIIEH